jgi:hypothetical protein
LQALLYGAEEQDLSGEVAYGLGAIPRSREGYEMEGGGALLFLLGLYFLPAIVALSRGHHQQTAIVVLNLLLGWTVIGWVGAMVWACTAVVEKAPQPRGGIMGMVDERRARQVRQEQHAEEQRRRQQWARMASSPDLQNRIERL